MSPRTGFVVAVVFSLAACHRAVPATALEALTPEQRLAREVDGLASRAERLLRAQDEAVWRNWTEGAPLDLSATLEEQRALYSREALERIDSVRRRTEDAKQSRALELLRMHFAGEYVALATASAQETLAAQEAALTFEVDEQSHGLRDLERLLARERNALTRQKLHQAASAVVPKLGPASDRLRESLEQARIEAGYTSLLELAAALRRTHPDRVAAVAERLLKDTDAEFRTVLERLSARELRLPFESVRARDLPRMFRSRDVDELFPAKEVSARAEQTLRGLGIDLNKVVKVDDRELDHRNPRPLALAFQVPDDVRFSFRPVSGIRAQASYLHEVGHALHAAFTRQPSFARARLGGTAVSRAFSKLFEGLSEDPIWLEQKAGLSGDRLQQFRAESAAWDLYLLRRNAGRLLFAVAVSTGQVADPAAKYGELMSRALGVPFEDADRAWYMMDTDATLASAPALESAVLAHQLRAQLEKRFGQTWWERPEAGDYLRSLWAHGTALDAWEMAKVAGGSDLAPDALIGWLGQALSGQ